MQRIFLVGCPRSGTTLTQSLLASAPGIVTFTESHIFDKCFGSRIIPFRKYAYDRNCVESTIARFEQENALPQETLDAAAWESAGSVAEAFIGKLDRIAEAKSASGWVEKTPDHLRRIGLIQSVAPDATFVHILRNPAGTVASLCKASREWGRPRSWLACALKWTSCAVTSATCVGKPEHAHVFYEDLVDDSRAESMRLFDRLDLEWDEGVLERYRGAACSVIAAGESWKQANLGKIRRKSYDDIVHNRPQKALLKILDDLYRNIRANASRRD